MVQEIVKLNTDIPLRKQKKRGWREGGDAIKRKQAYRSALVGVGMKSVEDKEASEWSRSSSKRGDEQSKQCPKSDSRSTERVHVWSNDQGGAGSTVQNKQGSLFSSSFSIEKSIFKLGNLAQIWAGKNRSLGKMRQAIVKEYLAPFRELRFGDQKKHIPGWQASGQEGHGDRFACVWLDAKAGKIWEGLEGGRRKK